NGFVSKFGPPPGATPSMTGTATASATATATVAPTPTATSTPIGAKIVAVPARLNLRPVGIGVGASSTAKLTIKNVGKSGDLSGNISIANSQAGNAFVLSAPGPFD